MSARYVIRLLLPGTETVASEFPCATLSEAARTMIRLVETVHGGGLYDELGELTVSLTGAGGRSLTETEQHHLEAIIQEHGGRTPDEGAVEDYRANNPRRKP